MVYEEPSHSPEKEAKVALTRVNINGLAKTIMHSREQWKVEEGGADKKRWEDNITEWTGLR